MSVKLNHRLNECTTDIIFQEDYCSVWDRIRIIRDMDRDFEDGPWQVGGVEVENGYIVGHTEYVSNWGTFEDAVTYGIVDLLVEIGHAERFWVESE